VDYAGRHRLHTIVGGPPMAVNRAAEIYRKGLERPDHDWNPGVADPMIGVQAHIYLDTTTAAAIGRVRQAYAVYHRNLTTLWHRYNVPIAEIDPTFGGRVDVAMERSALVAGTPETPIEHINRVTRETGISYVVFAFSWGDLTHAEIMRSMRLFAEEVMPEFQG